MAEQNEASKVTIELSSDEALVLFDWISRFNDDKTIQFEDQAEQRVLWDIECALEEILVESLEPDYRALLERARARVRDPSNQLL